MISEDEIIEMADIILAHGALGSDFAKRDIEAFFKVNEIGYSDKVLEAALNYVMHVRDPSLIRTVDNTYRMTAYGYYLNDTGGYKKKKKDLLEQYKLNQEEKERSIKLNESVIKSNNISNQVSIVTIVVIVLQFVISLLGFAISAGSLYVTYLTYQSQQLDEAEILYLKRELHKSQLQQGISIIKLPSKSAKQKEDSRLNPN